MEDYPTFTPDDIGLLFGDIASPTGLILNKSDVKGQNEDGSSLGLLILILMIYASALDNSDSPSIVEQ